jgi:ABC-type uncharacterized transport system permease subunit
MSLMLLEVSCGILLAVGSLALVIVLMEQTGLGFSRKNSDQTPTKKNLKKDSYFN